MPIKFLCIFCSVMCVILWIITIANRWGQINCCHNHGRKCKMYLRTKKDSLLKLMGWVQRNGKQQQMDYAAMHIVQICLQTADKSGPAFCFIACNVKKVLRWLAWKEGFPHCETIKLSHSSVLIMSVRGLLNSRCSMIKTIYSWLGFLHQVLTLVLAK